MGPLGGFGIAGIRNNRKKCNIYGRHTARNVFGSERIRHVYSLTALVATIFFAHRLTTPALKSVPGEGVGHMCPNSQKSQSKHGANRPRKLKQIIENRTQTTNARWVLNFKIENKFPGCSLQWTSFAACAIPRRGSLN